MELKKLNHIGAKTLERLNALQIYTPEDLLKSYPKKYTVYEVDQQGIFSGEIACFKCVIASKPVVIKYRRHVNAIVFYILLEDQKYKCIIFSGEYLRYKLVAGQNVVCYGKYKLQNKEFTLQNIFFEDFKCRINVDYGYKDIRNKLIQDAVQSAIQAGISLEESLPLELIEKYRLLTIEDLVLTAHFPQNRQDCIQVHRRRRYEDFFWYACSLESLRLLRGFDYKSPKIWDQNVIDELISSLSYELTEDQSSALQTIFEDLRSPRIMNRLIQGDVGCGKSIVSYLAAIASIQAGYQVAFMAPTELLAEQHYQNFTKLCSTIGISIALLTSSTKQKEKEEIYYKLLHQRISFIVGTHALIQEPVLFANLGLAIIDEQHRFGVNQRRRLIEKFKGVDALYLTATPIPRTLGLTAFGDLDLTSIRTMPLHRKPVKTKLLSYHYMENLYLNLKKHLENKEQIYVVVPLVNESDFLEYTDIKTAFEWFKTSLPEAEITMLHGKMKSMEKRQIMQDFKQHRSDILIATTVIEVGVDVSNATVMVILDAERYGLSQIHQLRGRVGRGAIQSFCYLVSKNEGLDRLHILEKTTDGFLLAEEDLKLRGPGDFLGEEQSGFLSFDFTEDKTSAKIWECAQADSKEYVSDYLNGKVKNKKMDIILQSNQLKKAKIN